MSRARRWPRTLLVTTALAASLAPVVAASAGEPPRPANRCAPHRLAVHDVDRTPLGEIAVWWCGPKAASVVHVTVPGTTYDHRYWDFPYDPDRYSFRRWAVTRGAAVVLHDRIGTGASGRPPAHEVDIDTHAAVLHQLVTAVRSGALGNQAPALVATIGHSQGAFIAATEAARYGDVDGTVLSGISHQIDPVGAATTLAALVYPAQLDPAFASEPAGYLTTRPGTRGDIFYHGDFDPEVVAVDEATKAVASAAEFSMAWGLRDTTGVTAPTLLALGEHDNIFCGVPCTEEGVTAELERAWHGTGCFEVAIQPGAGHDQNLHRNAVVFFSAVTDWTARLEAARRAGPGCPAPR